MATPPQTETTAIGRLVQTIERLDRRVRELENRRSHSIRVVGPRSDLGDPSTRVEVGYLEDGASIGIRVVAGDGTEVFEQSSSI